MKVDKLIPYNVPAVVGNEVHYVNEAMKSRKLSGDGSFNKKCSEWLRSYYQVPYATLTPSCTAALEMAYLLIDLKPGDEVIMPSFTFTSTATAVTLFGAKPVFVDVDSTLNLDLSKVEEAITSKTKAICPVHYAGTSCDIKKLRDIIGSRDIYIVEDAAQALGASYRDQKLGGTGDIAALSFHETKNVVCGEGGALIVKNPALIDRAEILKDKGTNRQRFLRGQVDKYTWQDKGSSYLLGELPAAYLLAQFEKLTEITDARLKVWNRYFQNLRELADIGTISLPKIPEYSQHNAHIFYLLTESEDIRFKLSQYLKDMNILAIPHYVPLHSAPAGIKFGRVSGTMEHTDSLANRLLRLPLFYDLNLDSVDYITQCIYSYFNKA